MNAFKSRRLALGLTQEQTAALIGVSLASIQRWERTGRISADKLSSVADALEVEPDALLAMRSDATAQDEEST